MIKKERAANSQRLNFFWIELGEGWISHIQSQNVILAVNSRDSDGVTTTAALSLRRYAAVITTA